MNLSGTIKTNGFGPESLRGSIPKDNLVANKYIIVEEIGRGKFGVVYRGEHAKNRTQVAIKMEPNSGSYNTIKYEATILNYLHSNGCRVIPSVLWYGIYRDHKCLAMDYYDQTIDKYLHVAKSKYIGSPIDYLKQVIKLIVNMVGILGQIHKHQIIHRDIKPENFMIKNGELHMIDFGIASAVDNAEEINREPVRDTIIGSPKYISYFIHQGYEPMYRDDLISVGYCFFYFVMGSLPWNSGSVNSGSVNSGSVNSGSVINTTNISINENEKQQVYPEIHILHEKNQVRKKWKEWGNIQKLVSTLSKKQPENHEQIFLNIFEYFSLCYNLQLEEQPFYEELCQVLQKNL
jgi:serine/threonine protein kinase